MDALARLSGAWDTLFCSTFFIQQELKGGELPAIVAKNIRFPLNYLLPEANRRAESSAA